MFTIPSRVRGFVAGTGYRALMLARLALRLGRWSPRGAGRLVAVLAKWVYDSDSAELRHQHAGNRESTEYAKVHNVRKANLHARGLVAGTITVVMLGPALAWTFPHVLSAVVGAVLAFWIVKLIPGRGLDELLVAAAVGVATWLLLPSALALLPRPPLWPLPVLAVVAVLALGYAGRPKDKALVDTTAYAGAVPPLRAPMVTAALCALGIAKMKEPDDIRLLMDVARQGQGYQVDLELPAGVTAADVMDRREAFAAALRRELGCVWPAVGVRHPGHLSLYVSDEPMSKARQAPWPLLKAGAVNLFQPAPLFTDRRGRWVEQAIAYTSWLVGSVPRMGKTYFVREFGLVAGLDVRAKVLAFDLKGTGDLAPLALFAHAYGIGDEDEEIDEQLRWMEWVHAEMRRRTKVVRELTLEQNPEKGKVTDVMASKNPATFGPIVVIVDECQVWFEEHARKEVREKFIAICRDLVKRGPALGIICAFSTQKPEAKAIPTSISDNVSARVCFKVNSAQNNNCILGNGTYAAGLRATQLGFEDKGVAYFKGDGADAVLARTVFGLDAVTSEKVATRARALREAAGLLSGDAAGEAAAHEAAQVNLLEDVRHVFQGRDRMHLTSIVDDLALLRSGIYGHLDAEALGGMLRAAGVRVDQVKIGTKNTSGVRREWLDVAATEVMGDADTGATVVALR